MVALIMYAFLQQLWVVTRRPASSSDHRSSYDIRVRPQTAMLGDIWGVSGDIWWHLGDIWRPEASWRG